PPADPHRAKRALDAYLPRHRHNTPIPLRRSPPVTFKSLLAIRSCAFKSKSSGQAKQNREDDAKPHVSSGPGAERALLHSHYRQDYDCHAEKPDAHASDGVLTDWPERAHQGA